MVLEYSTLLFVSLIHKFYHNNADNPNLVAAVFFSATRHSAYI